MGMPASGTCACCSGPDSPAKGSNSDFMWMPFRSHRGSSIPSNIVYASFAPRTSNPVKLIINQKLASQIQNRLVTPAFRPL
jgi:hypothetical protein